MTMLEMLQRVGMTVVFSSCLIFHTLLRTVFVLAVGPFLRMRAIQGNVIHPKSE